MVFIDLKKWRSIHFLTQSFLVFHLSNDLEVATSFFSHGKDYTPTKVSTFYLSIFFLHLCMFSANFDGCVMFPIL
jgi:hypothetical protein